MPGLKLSAPLVEGQAEVKVALGAATSWEATTRDEDAVWVTTGGGRARGAVPGRKGSTVVAATGAGARGAPT